MKINVWRKAQMLLPWFVCTAQEHHAQTASKPLCKHTPKAHSAPPRAPARQLFLSLACDSFCSTFTGTWKKKIKKKKSWDYKIKTSAFGEIKSKKVTTLVKNRRPGLSSACQNNSFNKNKAMTPADFLLPSPSKKLTCLGSNCRNSNYLPKSEIIRKFIIFLLVGFLFGLWVFFWHFTAFRS